MSRKRSSVSKTLVVSPPPKRSRLGEPRHRRPFGGKDLRQHLLDFVGLGVPLRVGGQPREQWEALKARAVAEELKHSLGHDPQAISEALRRFGVHVTSAQVAGYADGRFAPSRVTVNRLAKQSGHVGPRIVLEWPWELLIPRQITLGAIERICAPSYETVFKLPNNRLRSFNRRGRSRWHMVRKFAPTFCYLHKPGPPELFWRNLARFRAALSLGDFQAANAHYFRTVRCFPSIATHRALAPHRERLFRCMDELFRQVDAHFIWFSVNWRFVTFCIEHHTYGPSSLRPAFAVCWQRSLRRNGLNPDAPANVFTSVFRGNEPSLKINLAFHNLREFLQLLAQPDDK